MLWRLNYFHYLCRLDEGRTHNTPVNLLNEMKPCEYHNELTGLIASVSGLKQRRPSAGRQLLVESMVADIRELTDNLKSEILARVSREIWLEADEGIDYDALADDIQTVLPIELPKASAEENQVCLALNEALEALAKTLSDIVKALNRRYKSEDYVKLYEDELRQFVRTRGRKEAEKDFNQYLLKVGIGSLTMDDLEEYRVEKLQHMFFAGVFRELVAHRQKAPNYPNEIVFHEFDDGKHVPMKDVYKCYHFLRKMCTWEDYALKVSPLEVGKYFFAFRKEPNAKELRKEFFKYMTKIDFAQQAMAEIRQRQGTRLAELPDSRRGILEWLAEMVGYGEWVLPATDENILAMLHNALGVGMYELMGDEEAMSAVFWSMLEQPGNLRVVWQNLIGYFAEHRFFSPSLGAPALNEMFFDTSEYYQNIDKGRPSYQRKSKKWARIQPLLDRFVPRKE